MWLDRLEAEHANVRAALEHFLMCGDADNALRLSGAVWLYWQTRGHWTEGRRFLAAALALDSDVEPERLVNSMWGAALLAFWQGDVDEGEELADRLLELSRQAGLERGASLATHIHAVAATMRGDRARARALNEESVMLARRDDDGWLLSVSTNNLGIVYLREGDFEHAAELFEESLAIGEERGDVDRRARALTNLGNAAHGLGDDVRAKELYRRGLAASVEIGLVEGQIWTLLGIALCEAETGNPVESARLLGRMQRLQSDLRAAPDPDDKKFEQQTLTALRAALGPERLDAELAFGATLTLEDAIDLALGREAQGQVGAPSVASKGDTPA